MKRYFLELGLCLAAYTALLVLSLRLLSGPGIEGQAARTALSLAPMLPCAFACWVILRGLRRMDEMQRRIQLEALALAFTATALITFGYGFLENVGHPRLSMFSVWPLMAGLWILGSALGHLRYR